MYKSSDPCLFKIICELSELNMQVVFNMYNDSKCIYCIIYVLP